MTDQAHQSRANKPGADPLLRPQHFMDLRTSMGSAGLAYSSHIGHEEREESCPEIGETVGDMLTYLENLRSARPPSKVVVHPPTPSARELVYLLESAEAGLAPSRRFNVGLSMPDVYERRWTRDSAGEPDSEGQTVAAVLFDPVAPVGYLRFSIALFHDRTEREVDLHFRLHLVYVMPDRRGKGFGLDLSVACGQILRDVLRATYRAVPSGTKINPYVTADWTSEGGESITHHLVDCLDFEGDLLREFGRRRTVNVAAVELSAGY